MALFGHDARAAFKALNGALCIYKPVGIKIEHAKLTLVNKICKELNSLKVRPPQQRIVIEGRTNEEMVVKTEENLADNVLVVGPRYQRQDFRVTHNTHLGKNTSGVMLLGINEGSATTFRLQMARLTRAFKIRGELGRASDTHFYKGKVVEKASYKHVQRANMDKILSYMQAMHQRKMYEMSGVDIQSQAAYELAVMGPIRPANAKVPIIYGLKCVDLQPPFFTLEVQSIGESEVYLHGLVHELGIQLKTTAMCLGVQCIRHGLFTVEHALLQKHWNLEHIIENMQLVQGLLNDNRRLLRPLTAALA